MDIIGLTINFLGDSITEGVGVSNVDATYYAILQKRTGLCEARNYGISGTRFAIQKGPLERPNHHTDTKP